MSDAFEIGVSLALDDGVSAGIQAARRELMRLQAILEAGAVPLRRLREAAMGDLPQPPFSRAVTEARRDPAKPERSEQEVGLAGLLPGLPAEMDSSRQALAVPAPAKSVAGQVGPETELSAAAGLLSAAPRPAIPELWAAPASTKAGVGPAAGFSSEVTASGQAQASAPPRAAAAPVGQTETMPDPRPDLGTFRDRPVPSASAPVSPLMPALSALAHDGMTAFPAAKAVFTPASTIPPQPMWATPVSPKGGVDQPGAEADWPALLGNAGGAAERQRDGAAAAPAPAFAARTMAPLAAAFQPPLETGETPDVGARPPPPSLPAAPRGEHAQTSAPQQGDVYLDGMLVGRWMSRFLNREAARASSGPTSFDGRRGRKLPGATVGG